MLYDSRAKQADKRVPYNAARPYSHIRQMNFEFDQDIAISKQADGHYLAEISANWNIMTVPNGGYLLAVAANR